jgi:CheY-like chemotaxis protein
MSPVIAVVGSNTAFLNFVSDTVKEAGYQPVTCVAGKNAAVVIRLKQPTLVLIDLFIINGQADWWLAQAIRQHEATAHIPILLSSSDHSYVQANATDLLRQGYGVLGRPFASAEMLQQIQVAICRAVVGPESLGRPLRRAHASLPEWPQPPLRRRATPIYGA